MGSLGTISGLGVGSKLDLQGVLDKLRAIDDTAVTTLDTKKTKATERLTAFDSVHAKLVAAKVQALTLSLESNFLEKSLSGINDSIASATVAIGTADTTHSLEVVRLAAKSSFQSSGVAQPDTVVATFATTLAYQLGTSGQTVSVDVPANTTLHQLAELINTDPDNPGVTATVTNSGIGATPYSLVLTANNTGENNRISIVTPLPELALTELQGAGGASLNASFKVDGVTYARQSNSGITDVVHGVTLHLKGTGSTSFEITSKTSGIEDAVKNLVKTLQEALQDIDSKTAYDPQTRTFGPLAGSSAVRGVRSEVGTLLSTRINTGGTIRSLVDLGLEFNQDGSLTLNEDTLKTALANHFNEVKTLLVGKTGVTGVATLLTDKLTALTGITGAIATEKQTVQTQISRLDASITLTKARLDQRYDNLARQFAALDRYAARLQQQGDFLHTIITSFNNAQRS